MDIEYVSLSRVKVERPSWNKFKKRLSFCFWRIKTNACFQVRKVLYDNFNFDAKDVEVEDNNDDSEEACNIVEDLEREGREYIATRPRIEPRRTVLICTRAGEHSCNFVTTRKFERYILLIYEQARSWGMTTFIVDIAAPFGLLAFETLLALRKYGEEFNVYAFQSKILSKCKSFRLAPETDIERIELIMSADYFYKSYNRDIFFDRIIRCAGLIYTETKAFISKSHISDNLLKAWGVSTY